MITILFESKTLNELLTIFNNFYTDEAIEAISGYFNGKLPTLQEVCDVAIEYCNAVNSPYDDNVYLFTSPNGKKYTGQTTNWNERLKKYRNNKGSNPHWSNALKHHGFQAFDIEHYVIPTACADIVEKFMISWYNLIDPNIGYNKTSGGKNGYVMSSETRKKLREAKIGVLKSDEHKEALKVSWNPDRKKKQSVVMSGIQNPMFGRKHAPQTITKIRKSRIGKNNGLVGVNHPNFGKPLPKETISKIRKSMIGKKNPNVGEKNHLRTGENHPGSRPVVVNGTLFVSSREAGKEKFPKHNKNYVSKFISTHKKSNEMFTVSKEFYINCRQNNIIVNITREMHETYYYFI
jgi:group I intron endonuclease